MFESRKKKAKVDQKEESEKFEIAIPQVKKMGGQTMSEVGQARISG